MLITVGGVYNSFSFCKILPVQIFVEVGLKHPPLSPVPLKILVMCEQFIWLSKKFEIRLNSKIPQVILKNLEEQGIIKGGSVAVHMNRNRIRSRSRSPIKLHTNFEYVPSPKHLKQRVSFFFWNFLPSPSF